jgi:hypothetical protein
MGQIGQAMSNPNTGAPDPSGLNGTEWMTRLAGAGAKGLGQGMQNQPQRPQGNPVQFNPPQQGPAITPQIFNPQQRQNNAFFGQ